MKTIIFGFLLLLSLPGISQLKSDIRWVQTSPMPAAQVIYYDVQKPLVWPDFKGKPEMEGPTAALTVSGFGYQSNVLYNGEEGTVRVQVYCYFDKTKSWVKPDKKNAYILNHEQRHYDISFLAAHRFISKLRGTVFQWENVTKDLEAAYNESSAWMNRMQEQYDAETRNGLNRVKQDEWDAWLDAQVKSVTH